VIDCSATSPQAKWLREDLKANKRFCTAAFWHHPMYSSGAEHGDNPWTRPLWKILQSKRADIVLTGHDHDFEAFKRQDSYGQADGKRGITEFVVGTGGKNQRGFGKIAPNSIARLGNTYGFLSLRLKRGAYNWRFVDENGQAHNVGIAHCH
jgi:hypothetical protein